MKRLLAMSLTLAAVVGAANAAVFTFSTLPGATSAGGPVDATVTFTTSANTLDISVTNLLTAADVKNVGQNISDLLFTLNNVQTSGSVDSSSGTGIDVGTGGAVSSDPFTGTDEMGWALTNSSNTYHLNGLAGAAFVPSHTIIGGTAGDFTAYSNANNSIKNNGPHNPFAQGTATWELTIAGINSDTKISDVFFSYGTTAGDNVPTPEPASLAALTVGAVALIRRRRRA